MEDFESALGRSSPNPKFIPDGLAFDAIIKNETPVVSYVAARIGAKH